METITKDSTCFFTQQLFLIGTYNTEEVFYRKNRRHPIYDKLYINK
jgi:hypothetical protein